MSPNIEARSTHFRKREMTLKHSTGLHNHLMQIPLKIYGYSSRGSFVEDRHQLQNEIHESRGLAMCMCDFFSGKYISLL